MADDKQDSKDTDKKTDDVIKPYQNNEDEGYYFYPSRNKDPKDTSILKEAVFSWKFEQGARCRHLVQKCTQKSATVRFMMNALAVQGCPVDVNKHITCEPCKMKISGGFDFNRNQVVVCSNNTKSFKAACNTLSHEFLHAFDSCRAKFDVKNVEHVACAEIRAANLFHCSYSNAVVTGEASPIRIAARHQDCVKTKALASVMLVKSLTRAEGQAIVESVFEKCYNDLEPFGRRIRPNSPDILKAIDESVMFGYK